MYVKKTFFSWCLFWLLYLDTMQFHKYTIITKMTEVIDIFIISKNQKLGMFSQILVKTKVMKIG